MLTLKRLQNLIRTERVGLSVSVWFPYYSQILVVLLIICKIRILGQNFRAHDKKPAVLLHRYDCYLPITSTSLQRSISSVLNCGEVRTVLPFQLTVNSMLSKLIFLMIVNKPLTRLHRSHVGCGPNIVSTLLMQTFVLFASESFWYLPKVSYSVYKQVWCERYSTRKGLFYHLKSEQT